MGSAEGSDVAARGVSSSPPTSCGESLAVRERLRELGRAREEQLLREAGCRIGGRSLSLSTLRSELQKFFFFGTSEHPGSSYCQKVDCAVRATLSGLVLSCT